MESFIIRDFKFFAPVRMGENHTFAHFDTGATDNMLTKSAAQGLVMQDRAGGKGYIPIEQRLARRIDFVLGANTMLASARAWVLDKSQNFFYISDQDVDVYA